MPDNTEELQAQVESLSREVTRLRTMRQGAEDALARSELFNEALLRSLPAQIAVIDRAGDIVGVNNAWKRMSSEGASLALGDTGQNYLEICRTQSGPIQTDATRCAEGLQSVLDSDILTFDLNYADTSLPEHKWWLLRAVPVAHASGGLIIAQFDVTRQMRTEESLRYISASVRCLLWHATAEAHGDEPLEWDLEVVDEEAARRFLPVVENPGESYTVGWMKSILPEDRERMLRYADREVRAGRSYRQEFRCCRADGEIRWFAEDAQVEQIGEGRWRVVGVCTDNTESQRLEQQLLQSQKMDIVGRLASGLAHDFNNSLTAIMGFSGLAELELPFGHPAASYMQGIQQSATRASELLQQLLAFARRQSIEPRVVDLNGLLVEIDTVLTHLAGPRIEKMVLPKPRLGKVNVDPVQMKRVVIDLTDYARRLMADEGRLILETENVSLDAEYVRGHAAVLPGDYVMLALSCTGEGIPEETRAHLFEPFYAGVEADDRPGLGLAACYGIVKQSGGYIWVYSEPGHGATFKIYLPRVDDDSEPERERSLDTLPRGTETVLIVDDEPLVRSIAIKTLRTLGYQVLEASNGREAIRLVGSYPGKIDLLITDLVMPQIGGPELGKKLLDMIPGLRVIYMSGYTTTMVAVTELVSTGAHFLQKPFNYASLVGKVRDVLDELPAQGD